MYTDEDLSQAVKNGILKQEAVDKFRLFISQQKNTQSADEENFRLITGFNDIFVSISAFILMMSIGWLFGQADLIGSILRPLVIAILAWLLSLFFILKRRLALPALLFLVSFVVSIIAFSYASLKFIGIDVEIASVISTAVGVIAAWLHWNKFHVPITVAAGVASLVACLIFLVLQIDLVKNYINLFICAFGVLVFLFAMAWDSKDTSRLTRKSDVAFWLHLLAAPLIVHPIFSTLGIFDGESNLFNILMVIILYMLLGILSIVIDRRALMVSALVYVLYAFRELFETYGAVSSSLAISGIFIGSALLFLSAFWQKCRKILLRAVPKSYAEYIPGIN